MLKTALLFMTLTILSLFAACNIVDTEAGDTEPLNTLASEQEAILGKCAGPDNPGQGEFYPLDLGNSWTYTGERSMSIGDYESYHASVREKRSIVGSEELSGREYMLEKQVSIISIGIDPDDTITYWYRYRQDRAGLYEADIAAALPAGEDLSLGRNRWDMLWKKTANGVKSTDKETVERARIAHFRKIEAVNGLLGRGDGRGLLAGPPGGILPDEIQRLMYPLHPKQEWIIRDTPLFYSVVERQEVLDLPAGRMNGWRIRVYNEFLGDNDIVYLWYGRSGFLGMTVHLETEMDGVSGTMISDEDLYLESYDLTGKGKDQDEAEDGKNAGSKESILTIR